MSTLIFISTPLKCLQTFFNIFSGCLATWWFMHARAHEEQILDGTVDQARQVCWDLACLIRWVKDICYRWSQCCNVKLLISIYQKWWCNIFLLSESHWSTAFEIKLSHSSLWLTESSKLFFKPSKLTVSPRNVTFVFLQTQIIAQQMSLEPTHSSMQCVANIS